MLQRDGRVLGITDQLACGGHALTEGFDQGPMPLSRLQLGAVGQCDKRIDDGQCLNQWRGARSKRRVRDDAHESDANHAGEGEHFGSVGQLLEPCAIKLMIGVLAPMRVEQHVDIGHIHLD